MMALDTLRANLAQTQTPGALEWAEPALRD